MFGGFYIVPLYALIQSRSEPAHRSRIIAANNILNALFMVAAAVLADRAARTRASRSRSCSWSPALLNAAVAIYIYTLVPEFLMRFLVWMLIHSVYRLREERASSSIPERRRGAHRLQPRDASSTRW